jgi:hypothetical protein
MEEEARENLEKISHNVNQYQSGEINSIEEEPIVLEAIPEVKFHIIPNKIEIFKTRYG